MQPVLTAWEEGVTTITLNRPDRRTAFNDDAGRELRAAFEALDERTRLVVLTGAGDAFCAGADLNWMKKSASYSERENATDAGAMVGLFKAINECPVPVIGRVNGHAMGGGVGLVACCDIVVASERAKFGFTEVRLGLIPAVISPFVLGKINAADARRYFLTGEVFGAAAAREMGLVQEGAPADSLDDVVKGMVKQLLQNGPVALRQAKRLIFEVTRRAPADALAYAVDEIARLRVSPEGQEGLAAFLEKRAPQWI